MGEEQRALWRKAGQATKEGETKFPSWEGIERKFRPRERENQVQERRESAGTRIQVQEREREQD